MARCNGYRPRNCNRKQVEEIRARLKQTKGSQWQKAYALMANLTAILGHRGGPSGGNIAPRACRYCDYYGHTIQHCEKKKQDEQKQMEREIRDHAKFKASNNRKRMPEEWIRECDELIRIASEAFDLARCTPAIEEPGRSA